jgi:rare lipoprotein A
MYNRISFIFATFLFIPLAMAQEPVGPFTDVPPESSFFLPVNFLKEQNFVTGFSDGAFRPENPVSRAEALAMILKVNGICNDQITVATQQKKVKKPFRDVKRSDWFFDIVREAKKRKIVAGIGDGKFRPNEPVKLAEALRMLFEASETETAEMIIEISPGIAADAWYTKDISYAVSKTILTQQEDGSIFPPEGELTRGQLALLLYRFLKTQDTMIFGYASWYGDGLAKTKIPKNEEYAKKYLTAAHKEIPFGTIVKVTNVENGKSVEVVINDRGPYVTGRIIDLSKTAFRALEEPGMGLILVQIEQLE